MKLSGVKKLSIRGVVADDEWQALRKSFLGTWKEQPEKNVEALQTYLGDATDPLKLRRILNYLTGSAFRIGVIQHPAIDELLFKVRAFYNQ